MRKLFLATASVLALGLATSGAGFAAQPGNSAQLPDTSTPSATMPANGQSSSNPMEQRMQTTAPEHLSQTQLKQVQQKLKDEGLYKGEIDGQMGPNTKQAIEQFQGQNGLQKTGRLDQQTMAALNVNNNNGTAGEGSSALPSNQPANTNGSSNTGMNNGTSGSSTMPYNEPSNAGGLNTGTHHSNLQNGTSGTQPGTSGTLNPATNPSNR